MERTAYPAILSSLILLLIILSLAVTSMKESSLLAPSDAPGDEWEVIDDDPGGSRAGDELEITDIPDPAAADFIIRLLYNTTGRPAPAYTLFTSNDEVVWDEVPAGDYRTLDAGAILVHGSELEEGMTYFGVGIDNDTKPKATWPPHVNIVRPDDIDTSPRKEGFDPDIVYYVGIIIFAIIAGGIALFTKGRTDQIKYVVAELDAKDRDERRSTTGPGERGSPPSRSTRSRGGSRPPRRDGDDARGPDEVEDDEEMQREHISWGRKEPEIGWDQRDEPDIGWDDTDIDHPPRRGRVSAGRKDRKRDTGDGAHGGSRRRYSDHSNKEPPRGAGMDPTDGSEEMRRGTPRSRKRDRRGREGTTPPGYPLGKGTREKDRRSRRSSPGESTYSDRRSPSREPAHHGRDRRSPPEESTYSDRRSPSREPAYHGRDRRTGRERDRNRSEDEQRKNKRHTRKRTPSSRYDHGRDEWEVDHERPRKYHERDGDLNWFD